MSANHWLARRRTRFKRGDIVTLPDGTVAAVIGAGPQGVDVMFWDGPDYGYATVRPDQLTRGQK